MTGYRLGSCTCVAMWIIMHLLDLSYMIAVMCLQTVHVANYNVLTVDPFTKLREGMLLANQQRFS